MLVVPYIGIANYYGLTSSQQLVLPESIIN